MKLKSTWILIAVFAGLGAYVALVEEPSHRKASKAKEEEGLVFPELDTGKVTEIALSGAKGEARLTKSRDGRWYLTVPWNDRAEDSRVSALLAELKSLKSEKEIDPSGANLRVYGLERPSAVVTLSGATPSPVRLAVGGETPSGELRYFRVDSGGVKASKSYALGAVLVEPVELRSKTILESFPWARLKALGVESPGSELRLVKNAKAWRMEAPFVAEADPDVAGRLAEKLRWARISSFLEVEPGRTEEAFARRVTVRFTATGEEEPAIVELAEVDGQVWARTEGRDALFTVEKATLDALRVNPAELRRKRPILAKVWSVRRIELAAEGQRLVYEKTDGAWRRDGRSVQGAESVALQEYLEALEAGRATQVLDGPRDVAAFGLDAPEATAKLFDSEQGEQLLWVGHKGEKAFARAGNHGPVYQMAPDYVSKPLAVVRAARESSKPAPRASPK
ncbi:MAG: DUF4340 domain-containing protein [Deltaproteobacteria bacterium]|nr:DUF4340 domain-containing protein [Deltaproteobacteria bacterium]